MSTKRDRRIEHVRTEDLKAASWVACDAVRRGATAVTIADTRRGAARVTLVWPTGHSEWVTWETCPDCGHEAAAVGWTEAGPVVDAVEFDCPYGCRPNIRELIRKFPSRNSGRASVP